MNGEEAEQHRPPTRKKAAPGAPVRSSISPKGFHEPGGLKAPAETEAQAGRSRRARSADQAAGPGRNVHFSKVNGASQFLGGGERHGKYDAISAEAAVPAAHSPSPLATWAGGQQTPGGGAQPGRKGRGGGGAPGSSAQGPPQTLEAKACRDFSVALIPTQEHPLWGPRDLYFDKEKTKGREAPRPAPSVAATSTLTLFWEGRRALRPRGSVTDILGAPWPSVLWQWPRTTCPRAVAKSWPRALLSPG